MICKNAHPFLKIFPSVFVPVLRLCGMLPFSHHFQPDWKLTVYSVLILLICVLVKATTIAVINFSDQVKIEEVVNINRAFIISRLVKIVYPIIKSLIPFVAIFNAIMKRRFMYKFCIHLCKSDEFFECKELSLHLEKDMKLASKLVVLCLGVSLIAKLCSVLSLMLLKELRDWQVLLWVILLYLLDTMGFVAEMQFVLMSIALRTRFLQINNRLQHLFSKQDKKVELRIQSFAEEWGKEEYKAGTLGSIGHTNTCMTSPIFSMSCTFEHNSKEYPVSLFEKEFLPVKRKHVETLEFNKYLEDLRLRHGHLCTALNYLNLMFEYVLLVSIFSLFLMILLNIYSAIFGLTRDLLLTHLADTCFWLLSSLIRLVCPLVVTDSLLDQVRSHILT